MVDGRKLVGSAQLRERGALLQHGSILIDDDQPRIAGLASQPLTPALPAATLRACLGHAPDYAAVRDAAAHFAAPHRQRFSSAEWTWRS